MGWTWLVNEVVRMIDQCSFACLLALLALELVRSTHLGDAPARVVTGLGRVAAPCPLRSGGGGGVHGLLCMWGACSRSVSKCVSNQRSTDDLISSRPSIEALIDRSIDRSMQAGTQCPCPHTRCRSSSLKKARHGGAAPWAERSPRPCCTHQARNAPW
jgi:hypothetical protein